MTDLRTTEAVVTPPAGRRHQALPAEKRRRRRKQRRANLVLEWLLGLLASRWGEGLLLLAIFLVALTIRWPYLLRLPHFTDETVEIEWALSIWRGEIRPLTASDRYYGPLHPYLVAWCFWLFGLSIALPRAIVMVFGALTVVLTYLLGRALAGRRAGLIGAGLLATAPQHIIVNSHIAWQNSTTPFYTTLTFLALTLYLNATAGRGRRGHERQVSAPAAPRDAAPPLDPAPHPDDLRPRPHWLILAGFCYGLTLHTHVGTIVLAPALALTFLCVIWRAGAWRVFRTPWPWLAPLAGVLAYSPVLIHNLTNDLAGVRRVQRQRNYAYEMQLSWEKYWQNMGDLWLELLRITSNPMRIPQERWHYLTSPYLLLMAGLCAAGIVLLVRRRQPLPLCAILSTALIMPVFNKAYGQAWDRYMLTGRYVTFLLPLAHIAVAVAALALAGWLPRTLRGPWQQSHWRAAGMVLTTSLLALLVLYPLQPLFRYYAHEAAKDPGNASFLATVEFVKASRGPRTPVVIGQKLSLVDLKDGADAREIFDLLLDLERIPHISPRNTQAEIARIVNSLEPGDTGGLPLIIMTRDECWQMANRRPYQRVSERYRLRELYWTLPSYYAVYHYLPPGQPGDCAPATGPEPGE